MNRLAILALAVPLAACVKYNIVEGDGLPRARIGQTVAIGDFELTPLAVLEDSRCPSNVRCVWEGRLRLRARIDFKDGVSEKELTLGEPQAVGTGMLKLVEAQPYPEQGKTIYPEDYGFGFTYVPNIAQ